MNINILNKPVIVLTLMLSLVACSNEESSEKSAYTTSNESTSQPVKDMSVLEKSSSNTALSKIAKQGKAVFATCNACHNAELDPPLAPPMFGVQNRYKRAYPDKQLFVQQLVSFVQQPNIEKALMKRPVHKLGLMPPQALPKEDLLKVANYIYEESFALPCTHWQIAVKNAEAKGEVDDHIKRDKMKLERFCTEK